MYICTYITYPCNICNIIYYMHPYNMLHAYVYNYNILHTYLLHLHTYRNKRWKQCSWCASIPVLFVTKLRLHVYIYTCVYTQIHMYFMYSCTCVHHNTYMHFTYMRVCISHVIHITCKMYAHVFILHFTSWYYTQYV